MRTTRAIHPMGGGSLALLLIFFASPLWAQFPPLGYPCALPSAFSPPFPQTPPLSCPTPGADGFYVPGVYPPTNTPVGYSTCCQVVNAAVPDFMPDVVMPVKIATFQDCQVQMEQVVDLELRSEIPFQWGGSAFCHQQQRFSMFLKDQGVPFMGIDFGEGTMRYSRTFALPDPEQGPTKQVWRYVINGDAFFVPSATPTFWLPPCFDCSGTPTDQFRRVHFVGHMDYSCYELEGVAQWEVSISLSHHVGCYAHADIPTLNPRALSPASPKRHDDMSFHMVGPLPFTFLAAPPVPNDVRVEGGGMPWDAVRSVVMGTPLTPIGNVRTQVPQCLSESTLNTEMLDGVRSCVCEQPPMAPPIYYHDWILPWHDGQMPPDSFAQCWDQVMLVGRREPWWSIAPSVEMPTGFVQLYIGHWGAAGDWSGQGLLANLGFIRYNNLCYPQTLFQDHIVYGVSIVYDEDHGLPTFYEDGGVKKRKARLLMDFVDSVSDDLLPFHSNDWTYAPGSTTKNLSILVAGHSYSSLIWTVSTEVSAP